VDKKKRAAKSDSLITKSRNDHSEEVLMKVGFASEDYWHVGTDFIQVMNSVKGVENIDLTAAT
jgi:hypothetical protein